MPIKTPSAGQQKLIFWAALFLLLAMSILSLISANQLMAFSGRAERSQAASIELNRFLSHVQEVESGARGYVITGDPSHLEPYRSGVAATDASLERMRVIGRSEEDLRARLSLIEQLVENRIALAAELVDLRARGADAQSIVAAVEAGRLAMARVSEQVDSATAAERDAFDRRKSRVENQALITNLALAAGVILGVLALVWLYILSSHEAARRRLAEGELRTLNAELETRVEERSAELERSRELLKAVVENMPDTVFLKDVQDQFRYVLVNEAGERLFGRDRAELLGHVDHELFPRAQASLCHKEDEEVAQSGEERFIMERSVETPSGLRMIESRKVPIADANGQQHFVLGIVRDITDRRSIENQLRQVQRMDTVGRLTGGIAHDFNNILAIIIGNLDLLRESLEDHSSGAEMTDEALQAATNGAELVRRLLAFARKQHLEPTAVNLNERLPPMTALLQRTLGESIKLQVFAGPDLWPALVDPTQVDDALVNLAINARDAMAGSGVLTIETGNVTLDEDYAAHHLEVTPGEYVMLAVSDTGAGMTPEVVARAFEPFFTTKLEGQGTGLGLSQVYGWIKQSGGHIKIYSEIGHGTGVKLYLPRADAAQEESSSSLPRTDLVPGGHEQILVVEDNPNVRRTVLRQLKDLGYPTLEAEDAQRALQMAREGAKFDLLFTDIVMPGGMTGYELAEQLERLQPGLKVLFTSGYTELAVGRSNGERRGPLLSKPYRKQDLGRMLREVLDESR